MSYWFRNTSKPGSRWDDEPPGHHQHNHEPLPTVNEKDYQSSSSHGSRSMPASFELENVSMSGDGGDGGGWRIGMPWFRKSLSPSSTRGGDVEDPSKLYYGGLMRSQGSIPIAEPSTTPRMMPIVVQQANSHQQPPAHSKSSRSIFSFFGVGGRNDYSTTKSPTSTNSDLSKVPSFFRTLSHLTQHSTTGRDSLADFEDSEWTPPDSSYGAAIPVFRCIPKTVRRAIEFTMIALMIIGFVYLVVATSIHITNERNKSINTNSTSTSSHSSSNGGRIALDDDLYVEEYRANDDIYNDNNYNDDVGGGNDDAGGGYTDDGYAANEDNGCDGDDCYSHAYNDDDGNFNYGGANDGYYYTDYTNNNANDDYAYGGNRNRKR